MNKVSKIISLVLVLVLALSVMVMPASADSWHTGEDGIVKFSYSVEKYNGTDTAGNAAEDIYGLTVYVNATYPITAITNPIYYDRTKFTPIDGTDMSIMDWGYTVDHSAGLAGVGYAIPEGSDFADTNKYNKVLSAAADRVVNSRGAISGMGRAADKTMFITRLLDKNPNDATVVRNWFGGNDPAKYGCIDFSFKTMSNYCNIQAYGTDHALITLLFKLKEGADPNGAEFGFIAGGTKAPDIVTETSANQFYYSESVKVGYPEVHASSCTYTTSTPTSPVYSKTSQIRYDGPLANAGNATSAPFSIRSRAAMTAADFASICGTDEAAKIAITDVGFVYVANGTADVATAKEVVAEVTGEGASVANAGYYKKPVQQIQVKDGEYIWTCLIEKANYEDTASAVAYIVVNGTTYLFDAAYDTDFSVLYDTWAEKIPTA